MRTSAKAGRLMDEGRDNRLSLGDKLLAVAGLNNGSVFEEFGGRIGLAPATGREYRHTARMATPAICQLIAEGTMHVSYSTLREGARPRPGGIPADEGWAKLRTLLKEAREAGRDRVTLAYYQQVLGTAPALKELVGFWLNFCGAGTLSELLGEAVTAPMRCPRRRAG
ncbi:hypothetical protein [Streptomyces antimycoticus]|uniref:hypothetical protein n=1 Tax=Streptomyces antimycoticus TaxID=68175 RepID=UPI0038700599|nr:hypothetical protein OG751_46205 [Streptomyces antimycoticus]